MAKIRISPPIDDGLTTPNVRAWAYDKHHFLLRYLHAFTEAMKGKKWDSLHYVDPFAGAGVENVDVRGLQWGSPLIAAQLPTKFHQLHLIEKNAQRFAALSERMDRIQHKSDPQILHGDANALIDKVVCCIPEGALAVAFIDPFGLTFRFETLKKLASRKVDFIIYFPDHIDALRNAKFYYEGKPDSNLTTFLGTDEWEQELADAPTGRHADVLRTIYERQLAGLGYSFGNSQRITRPDGRFLYKLIFASRHKAGIKIWNGTALKEPDGQGRFDF